MPLNAINIHRPARALPIKEPLAAALPPWWVLVLGGVSMLVVVTSSTCNCLAVMTVEMIISKMMPSDGDDVHQNKDEGMRSYRVCIYTHTPLFA